MKNDIKNREIAIFDFYLGGHHIEYLHHIYMYATLDELHNYTFIIPKNFEHFGRTRNWPKCKNIKFLFFELEDRAVRLMKRFEKSKVISQLLKKFISKTGIKRFVLIDLLPFMPHLYFIIKEDVEITGILYSIPLYDKQSKFKSKLYNYITIKLLVHSKKIRHICLLNSYEAVDYYNKKEHTKKFCFLPDPYTPINCSMNKSDIHKFLDITHDKTVFIHFGGLTKRKGTLEILDAISMTKVDKLHDKCFIFAGRVIEDIKEDFYKKVENLKDKVQIIIFDQFCEYSLFGEICKIADYILIPYKNTAQSSGVISYASQFCVPVIGPAEGLLGNLIRKFDMGLCIENPNSYAMAEMFNEGKYLQADINKEGANKYLNICTPQSFVSHLLALNNK